MDITSSAYVKFDDDSQMRKLDYHSNDTSSPALSFLSFTIERPPLEKWKLFTLFVFLRVCFVLYGLFFLVFGIFEFIYRFSDLFWMLHVTMLVKMVVLTGSLRNIKSKLEWQSSSEFVCILDETISYGKSYFIITSACNLSVMGFYYTVWSSDFTEGFTNIALVMVFIFGTLAYTVFNVSVLIVSVAEAKQSYKSESIDDCQASTLSFMCLSGNM